MFVMLKHRKYSAEIVEVGINELRGYYKVRLLDYEDDTQPVIWVKDNVNRYVSNTHVQYLPLLPGDKVLIEFKEDTITSGVITQIITPKKVSDVLKQVDPNQLSHVNRYTIIRTDKNSLIAVDETSNQLTISFQSNTGKVTITPSSETVEHTKQVNIRAGNNITIASSNHVSIQSQRIDLGSGGASTSNTKVQSVDYATFQSHIERFNRIVETLNNAYQSYTAEDETTNVENQLQLLKTVSNLSSNASVRVEYNETNNTYVIYVKSINTYEQELKNKVEQAIENSKIEQTVEQLKKQHEQLVEQFLIKLNQQTFKLRAKISDALRYLEQNGKTDTELYKTMQNTNEFVNKVYNFTVEKLSNG
jgi:hypothetical protein